MYAFVWNPISLSVTNTFRSMFSKFLILSSAFGSVKFRYVDVIILPGTPFSSSSFSVSSSGCSPLKFMKATLK